MADGEHTELQELCEILQSFATAQELREFLNDLCTPAELQAMAGRWQVVVLLQQKLPYRRVSELTGISTATVTRVARFLAAGSGGYRRALELWQASRFGTSKVRDS